MYAGQPLTKPPAVSLIPRWLLGRVVLFLAGLGLWLIGSAAWAEESTPRRHVVLVQAEASPLTPLLREQLQARHGQYGFHLIETPISADIPTLLKQLRQYRAEHESELAVKGDEERLVLGEQSLSWREARLLMVAAWILAPRWQYSPLQLTGPHQQAGENGPWYVQLESTLTLTLPAFDANGAAIAEMSHQWPLRQELRIGDISRLAALVKEQTGQEVDPQKTEDRATMLAFLKQLDKFKTLEQMPPGELMRPLAEKQIPDMPPILAGLEQGQTPAPEKSAASAATPIGLYFGLRLGTAGLGLGFDSNFFNPQAEFEVGYDIGRYFGFPQFYVTLGGGASLPWQSFALPNATLIAANGEAGLLKQWAWGPWIVGIGVRGGILMGFLSDPFGGSLPPGALATNMTFGGTGLVQLQYRWLPSLKTGLDLGWRFYATAPGPWTDSNGFFPPFFQLPPLSSNGPLLNLFVSWEI